MFHDNSVILLPVLFVYSDRRNNGNACLAKKSLGDVFIHAHGRTGYICTHVRRHCQLQKPLQRAVFTERSVDHRKNNIHNHFFIFVLDIVKMQFVPLFEMVDQPHALFFQSHFFAEILIGNNFRLFLHVPATVSVDADRCHLVLLAVQGGNH